MRGLFAPLDLDTGLKSPAPPIGSFAHPPTLGLRPQALPGPCLQRMSLPDVTGDPGGDAAGRARVLRTEPRFASLGLRL